MRDPYADLAVEAYSLAGTSCVVKLRLRDAAGTTRIIKVYLDVWYSESFIPNYSWEYDWYEGEPRVEMLAVVPLEDLEIPDAMCITWNRESPT